MKKYIKICTVYRSLISICGILDLTLKKKNQNIYKPNVLSDFSIALHAFRSNLQRDIVPCYDLVQYMILIS